MNPQLGLDMTPPQQRPHAPAAIGILAGVALLAGLFAPPARAQAVPDPRGEQRAGAVSGPLRTLDDGTEVRAR